jgi:hypothetical protein
MFSGDDDIMYRCLGMYVAERHKFIVFIYDIRGYRTGSNLAENAVHGTKISGISGNPDGLAGGSALYSAYLMELLRNQLADVINGLSLYDGYYIVRPHDRIHRFYPIELL